MDTTSWATGLAGRLFYYYFVNFFYADEYLSAWENLPLRRPFRAGGLSALLHLRKGYLPAWDKISVVVDQLRDQAMNVLYDAIDPTIFESVKDLDRANKIRKRFEEINEGVAVVKDAQFFLGRSTR